MSDAPKAPITHRIGVRDLIHYACRTGDLTGATFGDWHTQNAGTRTHYAFYKELNRHFPGAQVESEVSLSLRRESDALQLLVRGRCDIRLRAQDHMFLLSPATTGLLEPTQTLILEVKTTLLPPEEQPLQGYRLHWLQCLFYACMNAEENDLTDDAMLTYGLAYVTADTLEVNFMYRQETLRTVREQVDQIIALHLKQANSKVSYRRVRDASIKTLTFPYDQLREGQREFMQEVLGSIRESGTLMIEAPTGIGKTISSLYPAIKALGHNMCDRIAYLTAKTPVRDVAAAAIQDMRENGLVLNSIILTAREKICFRPDICCEPLLCEYAAGYYDKLPNALADLLPLQAFDRTNITQAAQKYQVCPFELGLDLAYWCDVIIGDYNHGFDPRSHLTIFDDLDERQVCLVDEAHNLPERARTMFSAQLQKNTVDKCRAALGKLDANLEKLTTSSLRYFEILIEALDSEEAGFDRVEKKVMSEQVLRAPDFRSVSSRAPGLCRRLQNFISAVRPLLNQIEDFELKRPILDFFFDAQYFIRICDVHWNNDYILMFRREENDDYTIKQVCMNISQQLNRDLSKNNKSSRLFFSATLTPLTYYAHSICGRDSEQQPETLALESPFPSENMNLIIAPLSTVYRERQNTANELADMIALTLLRRRVNQLIFFPSYNYLNFIYPRVRQRLEGEDIDLILQRRSMDDRHRQLFLKRFSRGGRQVAGFAVLGSVFSEGIDLTGSDLGGVICVGTGLPQVTPELEILKSYYDSLGENGFMYAYVYPGFIKIMQAAGRLIRTETDTGFILLIDERFAEHDYLSMFPAWWHPHIAGDSEELVELLDETHDLPDIGSASN